MSSMLNIKLLIVSIMHCSLVKGGISLHLKDKENVGNLIESWSGEVFGGNTRLYLPKTVTSIVTAFLSDVPVNIFI